MAMSSVSYWIVGEADDSNCIGAVVMSGVGYMIMMGYVGGREGIGVEEGRGRLEEGGRRERKRGMERGGRDIKQRRGMEEGGKGRWREEGR
jgi:hypothetical protein